MKHRTITLESGDVLSGVFESRIGGESPRKKISVNKYEDELVDAAYAFAVLYSKEVLAEDGDIINEAWGIVAHLTSASSTPEPMHPDVFIANHFKLDGGTSTKMTPEVFEKELGVSVDFWKNKALANVIEREYS